MRVTAVLLALLALLSIFAPADAFWKKNKCKVRVCTRHPWKCVLKDRDCGEGNECFKYDCDPKKGCFKVPVDNCHPSKCETAECIDHKCVRKAKKCPDRPCFKPGVCNPTTGECDYEPIDCGEGNECFKYKCDPDKGKCVKVPEDNCHPNGKCETAECKKHVCVRKAIKCPKKKCFEPGVCNPDTGKCDFKPIVCESKNKCKKGYCSKRTGKCKFYKKPGCGKKCKKKGQYGCAYWGKKKCCKGLRCKCKKWGCVCVSKKKFRKKGKKHL